MPPRTPGLPVPSRLAKTRGGAVSEGVGRLDMTVEELTDAWVYVFGRFLVIRQEHADLAEAGVDYNVIKHNPPVVSGARAGAAPTFVNPNLDVVYSEAWIAVDESTPALLEVPGRGGRYLLDRADRRRVGGDHLQHQRSHDARPSARHVRVVPRRFGSRDPERRDPAGPPVGQGEAARSRADGRRPRRGGRAAAPVLRAFDRGAAHRGGGAGAGVHQHAPAGGRHVRPAHARAGAGRAGPLRARRRVPAAARADRG